LAAFIPLITLSESSGGFSALIPVAGGGAVGLGGGEVTTTATATSSSS